MTKAIQNIRLQNYRSYEDREFVFASGVNVIVGRNGCGKTNLLEAVLLSCVGRSYRAKDAELVRHEKPWARLDAVVAGGDCRTVKIVKENERATKEFALGGNKFYRLSMQKTLPVVLFEPNHLLMLEGSPERRREYLDVLLEQTTLGFSTLRRQYKRALAQRNALLKSGNVSSEQMFVWNIRLGQLGGQIAKARMEMIAKIQDELSGKYGQLAGVSTELSVAYKSSCDIDQYSSDLMHKLETTIRLDQERGFTSHGPHRDDMRIEIAGHQADETASRGEVRTIVLALKLIELEIIEAARSTKPLLLLDDVFSELDASRRKFLLTAIRENQSLITTTDWPGRSTKATNVIKI